MMSKWVESIYIYHSEVPQMSISPYYTPEGGGGHVGDINLLMFVFRKNLAPIYNNLGKKICVFSYNLDKKIFKRNFRKKIAYDTLFIFCRNNRKDMLKGLRFRGIYKHICNVYI